MVSYVNKCYMLLYLSVSFVLSKVDSSLSPKEPNMFIPNSDLLKRFENLAIEELNFDEQYRMFEKELENGTAKYTRSRQKRYVYLNTESGVEVGFLIVIPITVVLPSMTNLFNNWRRKRSISSGKSTEFEEISTLADPISSYFDLLDIPETECQLRAICEFSGDPSQFFPLSDIIISKVRDQLSLAQIDTGSGSNINGESQSLLNRYADALNNGSTFGLGKCHELYNQSCKYSMEKLLNMSIMKFWSKLQKSLNLKFDDVLEFPHL